MEATCSSETSMDFQRTTRRYIPVCRNLHNQGCENFRPYVSHGRLMIRNNDSLYVLIMWAYYVVNCLLSDVYVIIYMYIYQKISDKLLVCIMSISSFLKLNVISQPLSITPKLLLHMHPEYYFFNGSSSPFSAVIIYSQTVELLGRVISPSQGRYLNTGQHKQNKRTHRHPCFKWDSNPGSQCPSERRQFMP
jgi:hypothetical protein